LTPQRTTGRNNTEQGKGGGEKGKGGTLFRAQKKKTIMTKGSTLGSHWTVKLRLGSGKRKDPILRERKSRQSCLRKMSDVAERPGENFGGLGFGGKCEEAPLATGVGGQRWKQGKTKQKREKGRLRRKE